MKHLKTLLLCFLISLSAKLFCRFCFCFWFCLELFLWDFMNACFCMRLCNPVVRLANSGNDFDFGFCVIIWLWPKLIFAAFTAFVFAVPSSHSIHLLLWHCSVSAFRRGTKMHSSLADGQAVGICIQLYGIGPNNKHVCTLKRNQIFRRNPAHLPRLLYKDMYWTEL